MLLRQNDNYCVYFTAPHTIEVWSTTQVQYPIKTETQSDLRQAIRDGLALPMMSLSGPGVFRHAVYASPDDTADVENSVCYNMAKWLSVSGNNSVLRLERQYKITEGAPLKLRKNQVTTGDTPSPPANLISLAG